VQVEEVVVIGVEVEVVIILQILSQQVDLVHLEARAVAVMELVLE